MKQTRAADLELPPLYSSETGAKILDAWKKRVKCVATDIDGTITIEGPGVPSTEKGGICQAAMERIRRLAGAGIEVILVSGRPLATMEGLAMYLGLTDRERTDRGAPLIAENGAVIKMNGETIRLSDRAAALGAVQRMRSQGIITGADYLTYDNIHRLCDVGIYLATAEPAAITAWLNARPELGLKTFTSNVMTHIVSAEVSKAHALAQVLERMGIGNDEVIVSGDSETDVSLFEEFPMSLCVANYFETVPGWREFKLPALRSKSYGGAGFAEVFREIIC